MSRSMIVATAPFSFNSNFIDRRWKLVSKNQERRSHVLEIVDFAKAEFISSFREGDGEFITGEVKFCRLKEDGRIIYGITVFEGLWQNYLEKKETSVLEILFRERKITFMTFFGNIFLDPVSHKRCVLALRRFDRTGDKWIRDVYWLDLTWSRKHVSVVSSE